MKLVQPPSEVMAFTALVSDDLVRILGVDRGSRTLRGLINKQLKVKQIRLTRGLFALVDDADFGSLVNFHWIATPSQHGWRAYRRSRVGEFSKRRTIYMHAQILGFPSSEVDHKNHNGLDNRRINLRLANRQQQAANSVWKRPHGFRGIYPHKGKWHARLSVNYRTIHLGGFTSKKEAAEKYDEAAKLAFGEFAVLNFPRTTCTLQRTGKLRRAKLPSRMKG